MGTFIFPLFGAKREEGLLNPKGSAIYSLSGPLSVRVALVNLHGSLQLGGALWAGGHVRLPGRLHVS
jgi:hypothetical protein